MLTRVLVANRGEIARRVFRTCRDLGLSTVAVYSDADAGSPHVAEADAAVRLPGEAPADTYLRAELLIEAALRSGADAVHPGYGFLSENAAFARAVQDAGLTWIGPPPAAIEAMGSKIEAKRLMAAAGVPVLRELPPGNLTEADLPVLIKASAGGGGRGMRIVRTLAELPAALEAASPRRHRRSAIRRCSASPTSSPAGTSRCRSWPTTRARSGRSASASARSSGGTRRSSRKRRRRSCSGCPACGSGCSRPRVQPRPRSATATPAPSSSWPTRPAGSTSWR